MITAFPFSNALDFYSLFSHLRMRLKCMFSNYKTNTLKHWYHTMHLITEDIIDWFDSVQFFLHSFLLETLATCLYSHHRYKGKTHSFSYVLFSPEWVGTDSNTIFCKCLQCSIFNNWKKTKYWLEVFTRNIHSLIRKDERKFMFLELSTNFLRYPCMANLPPR